MTKDQEYFYVGAVSNPLWIDPVVKHVFSGVESTEISRNLILLKKALEEAGTYPSNFPYLSGLSPSVNWNEGDDSVLRSKLRTYTQFLFSKSLTIGDSCSQEVLLDKYRERVFSEITTRGEGLTIDSSTSAEDLCRLVAEDQERGMSTGFPSLDEYIRFHRAQTTVLIGQTGGGKSMFCCNVAARLVMHGMSVIYISTEMSQKQIAYRVVRSLRRDQTTEKWVESLGALKGSLHVQAIAAHSYSPSNLRSMIAGAKADIAIIDYLGQLTTEVKCSSDYERLGYVASELNELAKCLDIPILTVTQANRSSTVYPSTQTTGSGLASMADSWKIGWDAAVVLRLSRDSRDLRNNTVSISIEKNRFGKQNTKVRMLADFAAMRIDDLPSSTLSIDGEVSLAQPEDHVADCRVVRKATTKASRRVDLLVLPGRAK